MTALVGAILILVFLAFATLMFLERLSALLALPLMAVSFVLIAAIGDVAKPAQPSASNSGTNPARTTADTLSDKTRFEQWRAFRKTAEESVAARETAFDGLVEGLREILNRTSGADEFSDLRASLDRFASENWRHEQNRLEDLNRKLAEYPDFLAKPPMKQGRRAAVQKQLLSIPVESLLNELERVVKESPEETLEHHARLVLEKAAERQDESSARIEQGEGASGFWTDATAYIGGYLGLTLGAGSLSLYTAIIATLFGGMFAMYVKNLKIAERLVYWTAEFAGDRPIVVAMAVFLSTAVIFTSVGGLGTVMMLGTIILPILRSIGLSPVVGAGVFLMAIATGGTLHPVTRRLWLDFYGIPAAELDRILWTMVALYVSTGTVWITWGVRRALLSSFHATEVEQPAPATNAVPARLMIAPLIPVAMVYFFAIDEIVSFTVSIAYMFVCVCRRDGATRHLARSIIEGAQAVVPPVLLMIGIGLLITSLATPPVQGYLRPLIAAAAPETRATYILVFAIGAPLALYRGPLNVWGMGLAVSATLLTTTSLPATAVLGAILAAGMLQGVCDPTNTANVWIAGFQGVGVNRILRYTLLPVWAAACIAVVVFAMMYL